jgi:uncharacterized membrane protein YeaQ/YmgE (transglycosylase-associated protein family)
MALLWLLLVGLIAGWLAGYAFKGRGFGTVGNMVVGVVGAFVGAVLFRVLGISAGSGILGAILTAFVGAVALLLVVGWLRKR